MNAAERWSPQFSVLRLMPKEEIREAKVEGFKPSNLAAPLGPETFPLVCFKALMMASRSYRFTSSRVGSLTFTSELACSTICSCGRDAGRSKVSGPSRQSMTARSTVL
jgi:hypothetical protein